MRVKRATSNEPHGPTFSFWWIWYAAVRFFSRSYGKLKPSKSTQEWVKLYWPRNCCCHSLWNAGPFVTYKMHRPQMEKPQQTWRNCDCSGNSTSWLYATFILRASLFTCCGQPYHSNMFGWMKCSRRRQLTFSTC